MNQRKNYFKTPFDVKTLEWQNPFHCKTEDLLFMAELTMMMFLVTGSENYIVQHAASVAALILRTE